MRAMGVRGGGGGGGVGVRSYSRLLEELGMHEALYFQGLDICVRIRTFKGA